MHIVFIGGAQRAGTTLVQTLIANALGDAAVLPEAHAIHGLIEVYRRGMFEWSKNSQFFGDRESFREYIRSCVEQILVSVGHIHGSSEYVVLKDPNFALVQDRIPELFPQATSLFCARDPRDIVCSFLHIELREEHLDQRRKKYSGRNIPFYCSKINRNYEPALSPDFPALLVKYEDVATDPGGELTRLSAETGLPLAPPDLDNMTWTEAEVRHKASWVSPLEGRRPSTESVGRFRELLSPAEIAYVEKACSSILARFDYEPVGPSFGERSRFPLLSRLRQRILPKP